MLEHEKRIRDFLSERAAMRGLCPEQISGANGVSLYATDLRALLADLDAARDALQAQQSTQGDTPAEVSDEQIHDLAAELELDDPRADLIAFARAILALRPQAVPMTDERLAEVLTTAYGSPEWTMDDVRAARAVEAAAHGITAPAGGEG